MAAAEARWLPVLARETDVQTSISRIAPSLNALLTGAEAIGIGMIGIEMIGIGTMVAATGEVVTTMAIAAGIGATTGVAIDPVQFISGLESSWDMTHATIGCGVLRTGGLVGASGVTLTTT